MPAEASWEKWIAALSNRIWEGYYSDRIGRRASKSYREKGRVTEEEWDRICELVRTEELVCEMTNACMGFGFGVRFYQSAPYPGTKPEQLLMVTSDHFSDHSKSRPKGDDNSWGRFEKLVYAKKNVQLLEFNGFGKPREKSYYDY